MFHAQQSSHKTSQTTSCAAATTWQAKFLQGSLPNQGCPIRERVILLSRLFSMNRLKLFTNLKTSSSVWLFGVHSRIQQKCYKLNVLVDMFMTDCMKYWNTWMKDHELYYFSENTNYILFYELNYNQQVGKYHNCNKQLYLKKIKIK